MLHFSLSDPCFDVFTTTLPAINRYTSIYIYTIFKIDSTEKHINVHKTIMSRLYVKTLHFSSVSIHITVMWLTWGKTFLIGRAILLQTYITTLVCTRWAGSSKTFNNLWSGMVLHKYWKFGLLIALLYPQKIFQFRDGFWESKISFYPIRRLITTVMR